MVGVPVIVNHTNLNKDNADDLRVGVVNSVWYDDKDGWYWCDGIIWDEDAQSLITNKNWSVSCSYDVKTANDEGGSENNIKYDMEFLDGVFTHLALVDNPRYERANIVFNSKTVIENGNLNKYPAGAPDGKGGQFAPTDKRSFKNYTLNILKRANLLAGVQHFETSQSGYAVRFTIPNANFVQREQALVKALNKDKKVHHYAFGDTSDGQIKITIQFVNNNANNEKEQDEMILDKLKEFVAQIENEKDDQDGRWVTIKGTHVFIKDGQSVEDAMKEHGFGKPSSTGEKNLKESNQSYVIMKRINPKFGNPTYHTRGIMDHEKAIDFDSEDLVPLIYKTKEDYLAAIKEFKKSGAAISGDDSKLEGKYAKEDVDFDEEQLKKDLKAAQELGYKEVEDIAEFLGLDEDEVRETIAHNSNDSKLQNIKTYNAKETEMTLIEELKKLITSVENNKEKDMDDKKIENEKVDKRKLIDEVAGIMKSAGCDDELIRTAIGKMEKIGYDKSEAGTADNEKEEDKDDKTVKNEDAKDKKEAEDLKKDEKEDVENKCKNSVDNAKGNEFFEKMNKIYNSSKQIKESETGYESRQQRLEEGAKYF